MSLVSIVMPVHNAAAWLPRSVSSVIGQSYKDWELVAVDDGSSDASLSVLKHYASMEPRVRVLSHDCNTGAGAARNTALAVCRGQYVSFLDADDELPIKSIEWLLQAAEESTCPLVTARYDWRRISSQKPIDQGSGHLQQEYFRSSQHLQSIPGSHCCNLYAMSLITVNNLSYPDDLAIGEDQVWQVNALLAAERIAVLDRIVYIYHHYNDASLTRGAVSVSRTLDDIEHQRRIAHSLQSNGLRGVALARLEAWSYSIKEYWHQLPHEHSLPDVLPVFKAMRDLADEFNVLPWNEHTPTEHKQLLSHILNKEDEVSWQLLTELSNNQSI
ncbi:MULTISPECIES: glycosyltransferase family 2 protein [Aphanothece]|uniref:glycosyltransferase family 2 protein n=1 Tax=Aphanothece TaxID=1121 RepID=UPI00398544AD